MLKESFVKYGIKEDKIIKVPYGVDLQEFSLTKSEKKKIDKFRIISTGSISIRKGSHYLLEAFDNLRLPNSELIFIGDISDDFKQIKKKYSNIKNIKFIKKQNQEKLKFFYNDSDLFILCSIEEGLAMVQAQAMACGLPVICTTNTGGSEIIDDGINGYVIPIRNSEILMDKIKILYKDREQTSRNEQKCTYKS